MSTNSADNAQGEAPTPFDEEVLEYTVYKSKFEFDRLRRSIKNMETLSTLFDVLLLVLFGIIEIVVYIIAMIVGSMPVLVAIPQHMYSFSQRYNIDQLP
jgi:hypothetical protein